MSGKGRCVFHRDSNSLTLGRGIGYCDIDCAWVICDGDRKFCENPQALVRYPTARGRKTFNPPSIPMNQEIVWR